MKKLITFLLMCASVSSVFSAIREDGKTFEGFWISEASEKAYGGKFVVMKFRRTFELDKVPQKLDAYVSADNRYKLFVNGKQVAYGPARGDLENWYYDTVDIAPHLKKGKNVISALVWNGGLYGSHASQISLCPAFFFDTEDSKLKLQSIASRWKVKISSAFTATQKTNLGTFENFDASKYDWSWTLPEYNDKKWWRPRDIERGSMVSSKTGAYRWLLTKRDIPTQFDIPQRFKSIRRFSGVENVPNFISGNAPLTIPANTKCEILLDNGVLTTAFPRLLTDNGAGAKITIKYDESLWDKDSLKGNRNEIDGKSHGKKSYLDIFKPDGKTCEFIPLWYRPFRYVSLIIETKDQPLIISDFSHNFTSYPFEEKAKFSSPDSRLSKVWDIAWRTILLCANETYMDCPYYEQLQYVGDTRIQALVSLYVSGDARLMRKAIKLFASSRNSEGLTMSRYPSKLPQVIPPFSLYWVQMLHDYAMHCDDQAFVKEMTPCVKTVMEWFERQIDSNTGMLSADMPYWNFCDWAMSKNSKKELWGIWDFGSAPVDKVNSKGSAIHTLHFASALKDASKILKRTGEGYIAKHYDELSEKLTKNVMEKCWDEKRGLIMDYQGATTSSQHVNIWGILSDAIDKSKQADVMQRIMKDDSLAQCSLYYRYYLAEALRKVNAGEKYISELYPWHEMVADGLTTFAEKVGNARSDCHAWSSSPNYHLLSLVCGIMPSDYGFSKVKISPNLCGLEWVKGKMPHQKGFIEVNFKQVDNGLVGEITLPNGLEGEFEYRGKTQKLSSGKNIIDAK